MLLMKMPAYQGRQTMAVITWSPGGSEKGSGVSVAMDMSKDTGKFPRRDYSYGQ